MHRQGTHASTNGKPFVFTTQPPLDGRAIEERHMVEAASAAFRGRCYGVVIGDTGTFGKERFTRVNVLVMPWQIVAYWLSKKAMERAVRVSVNHVGTVEIERAPFRLALITFLMASFARRS